MATPVLDFGAFTTAEMTAMLTAAKTEFNLRVTTGRVRTGSSAAQSYGLDVMTTEDLIRYINGLTAALGLTNVENRVKPNFNSTGPALPSGITFGTSP